MFNNRHRNEKGFTLVEVIVVAVIVAVLALVGIQLYQGYAIEARRNTAENLAASAAGFLQTVLNTRDSSYLAGACPSPLTGPDSWDPVLDSLSGNAVTFKCPAKSSVIIESDSVRALVNGVSSIGSYRFK
ncbi:MAG: prepilin-type N-terminal cleavage/methylation domain-containing protein [Chitinispirillaceae bacterium]|nr:prepilin-type N-terminal cleavage/methylation domain-containing protein [Chitinispirillaceae bacterium]